MDIFAEPSSCGLEIEGSAGPVSCQVRRAPAGVRSGFPTDFTRGRFGTWRSQFTPSVSAGGLQALEDHDDRDDERRDAAPSDVGEQVAPP